MFIGLLLNYNRVLLLIETPQRSCCRLLVLLFLPSGFRLFLRKAYAVWRLASVGWWSKVKLEASK